MIARRRAEEEEEASVYRGGEDVDGGGGGMVLPKLIENVLLLFGGDITVVSSSPPYFKCKGKEGRGEKVIGSIFIQITSGCRRCSSNDLKAIFIHSVLPTDKQKKLGFEIEIE